MADSKSNINILIGCTGSVASIKVPKLAETFKSLGYSVLIVPTFNALYFLRSEASANGRLPDPNSVNTCSNCKHSNQTFNERKNGSESVANKCLECETVSLYPELEFVTDKQEWESWKGRGDPVKHIELRNWGDVLVIAPLDANTLAKIAQGLCDNLLTCIVRAWDMTKPLLFCPAMNTQMYLHPFTSQHISILKNLGFIEIEVTSKTLICGETGTGAMAEVDVIVEKLKNIVEKNRVT